MCLTFVSRQWTSWLISFHLSLTIHSSYNSLIHNMILVAKTHAGQTAAEAQLVYEMKLLKEDCVQESWYLLLSQHNDPQNFPYPRVTRKEEQLSHNLKSFYRFETGQSPPQQAHDCFSASKLYKKKIITDKKNETI